MKNRMKTKVVGIQTCHQIFISILCESEGICFSCKLLYVYRYQFMNFRVHCSSINGRHGYKVINPFYKKNRF
jgi:hypothetical protein